MANTDTYNDLYMPHFRIYNNNQESIFAHGNKIENGKWYTLIGIYDEKTLTFCINNNCSSSEWLKGMYESNLPIILGGAKSTYDDHGYNTFSDLLIYDRAITEEEKNSFATDMNPKNTNDLILWYKFIK